MVEMDTRSCLEHVSKAWHLLLGQIQDKVVNGVRIEFSVFTIGTAFL